MAEEKSLEEMLKEAQAKLKEYEELTAKQKAAIDNACSDAAKHKKDALDWQEKYKATLSEQEKKELETKQEREQMLSELNVLKSEKRIASYKSKLMEIGYDADTASNTFCCGVLRLQDHYLHGAHFNTLATADTVLFIDHIDTGLGVLCNCFVLTDLHALAALDTSHRLCTGTLCDDLDAAKIRIELLIKSNRTSAYALQASHTFGILLDSEFLHPRGHSFICILSKTL